MYSETGRISPFAEFSGKFLPLLVTVRLPIVNPVDLRAGIRVQVTFHSKGMQGRPFDFRGSRFLKRIKRQRLNIFTGVEHLRTGFSRKAVCERSMHGQSELFQMMHDGTSILEIEMLID